MMKHFSFGQIALLNYPFIISDTIKRRPALIINDFNDDDVIVCRITSQIYKSKFDVNIEDWEDAGLKLPSVIRVHKLATLEKSLVERIIGQIDIPTKIKIRELIAELTD